MPPNQPEAAGSAVDIRIRYSWFGPDGGVRACPAVHVYWETLVVRTFCGRRLT